MLVFSDKGKLHPKSLTFKLLFHSLLLLVAAVTEMLKTYNFWQNVSWCPKISGDADSFRETKAGVS